MVWTGLQLITASSRSSADNSRLGRGFALVALNPPHPHNFQVSWHEIDGKRAVCSELADAGALAMVADARDCPCTHLDGEHPLGDLRDVPPLDQQEGQQTAISTACKSASPAHIYHHQQDFTANISNWRVESSSMSTGEMKGGRYGA